MHISSIIHTNPALLLMAVPLFLQLHNIFRTFYILVICITYFLPKTVLVYANTAFWAFNTNFKHYAGMNTHVIFHVQKLNSNCRKPCSKCRKVRKSSTFNLEFAFQIVENSFNSTVRREKYCFRQVEFLQIFKKVLTTKYPISRMYFPTLQRLYTTVKTVPKRLFNVFSYELFNPAWSLKSSLKCAVFPCLGTILHFLSLAIVENNNCTIQITSFQPI